MNFSKKITLLTFLILTLYSTKTFSQEKLTTQEYIERYKHIAIDHMAQYGIPASITMAQGILESNSGNSPLAAMSNNHFGIKCKSNWTGDKVYYDDDAQQECFRKYDSVEASYHDHAEFLLQSSRYESLFAYASDDYKSWAHGLKAAGYATNPEYANLLIKVIEENQLYLLDSGETLVAAQPKKTTPRTFTRQEYVEMYKYIAIDHMERYGIPASITLAQGILESNSGNSQLARESNNHFGIKCGPNWKGESVAFDDDKKGECFRKYDSVEESYNDHAEFLDQQPRYNDLFAYASDDYQNWAKGLKRAGYATNPQYADVLIKIIEDDKLYLFDKDNGVSLYASHLKETSGIGDAGTTSSSPYSGASSSKIDPNNYRVSEMMVNGYSVYTNNQTPYIVAREGYTLEDIANTFSLSLKTLCKYNELKPSDNMTLTDGQIIYIARKQNSWLGNARRHKVREGETLLSISQDYGIRLSKLAKMNKMSKNQTLQHGAEIKLKKE